MEINFRRLGVVLVLTSIAGSFLVRCKLIAQAEAKGQEITGELVLSKLFPPIYPRMAQEFLVSGDVHLKISIRSDGSIASVAVIDGQPMLRQAALESARRSQFDCKQCGRSNLVERTFTYSFQFSPEQKPADSDCCLEEQAPSEKAETARVSQADERITITVPARCVCSAEFLGTLMDRRMRLIAGNEALDCGKVKVNGDPRASPRCAHQAISRKKAFFVRLDSIGMDSFLSDGFAGDRSGNLYKVRFDSLGWGHSPGVEILDNGHNAVQACRKPVRIRKELSSKGVLMGYDCTPWEKDD